MQTERLDPWATLLVVVLVTAVPVGAWVLRRSAERPTSDECERLAERYARFVAQARDPDAPASKAALQAAAVSSAAVTRCKNDLTRSEAQCALAAGNADEMERCVR